MKLKKITILIFIAILSLSFAYRIDNLHRVPDSDDLAVSIIRSVDFGAISKTSLSLVIVNSDTLSSNGGDFYGEIIYPAEKSEVTGEIMIKAVAISYPHPIDHIEFYINNNKIGTVENQSQEYFNINFDTDQIEDVKFNIQIVIHNTAGESIIRSNNVLLKK